MPKKIDLHLHTLYSDGVYSPIAVVDKAKEAGLDIISITDHDNLTGIEEAARYGKKIGIEVIPGIEISTDIEDKEIHLLGYFLDLNNDELQKSLIFFREERFFRAKRIIKKLNQMGINLSLESVMEIAKGSAIGRPHIALALMKEGYVGNFYEAFAKFIGNDAPAFEKKIHISPESAVKLINDAGGLTFLAHPANIKEALLYQIIKSGIDGIEVVHPSHSPQQIKNYKGIANEYYLLESGGSDFHGGSRNDEPNLGKYYITEDKIDAMRKRLIKNRN